jgi:hypothetical protein
MAYLDFEFEHSSPQRESTVRLLRRKSWATQKNRCAPRVAQRDLDVSPFNQAIEPSEVVAAVASLAAAGANRDRAKGQG